MSEQKVPYDTIPMRTVQVIGVSLPHDMVITIDRREDGTWTATANDFPELTGEGKEYLSAIADLTKRLEPGK